MEAEDLLLITVERILLISDKVIFRNSVEVWYNKLTTFNVRIVSMEVIFRDTKVLQVKTGENISMMI